MKNSGHQNKASQSRRKPRTRSKARQASANHGSRHDARKSNIAPRKLANLQLNVVATLTNLFVIGLLIFLARAFHLQMINDSFVKKLKQQRTALVTDSGTRGNIFDRNAQVLAQNVKSYKIQLDPTQLDDKEIKHLLTHLPTIFPGIELDKLETRLRNKARREALISKNASYQQYEKLKKLTKKFIGLTATLKRIYPKGKLAGPFLGFVSLYKDHLNSAGRAGIEQAYDWALSGHDVLYETQKNGRKYTAPVSGALYKRSSDGRSIMTTIDMRLQQITEAYLSEQVEDMGAKQGVAVVMDPHTGDILAVAQVPTYDPNKYNTSQTSYQNIFISSQVEPGSTMKPFLIAAALNENLINVNSRFPGMGGTIKLGRFQVKDSHKVEDDMSTLEIIKFSSNIGAIQVAQLLGKNTFYSYLKNFGFGDLTNIGLYGEIEGKVYELKKWNPVNLATMSYGYGLNVTPIQMTQALCAIANGGQLIMPRVVKALTNEQGEIQEEFPVRVVRRVISEKVAKRVVRGMEMVVEPGGTAPAARINGYRVAGKTGTTRKVKKEGGGYSKTKKAASFMGFAPANNPRLAIYINIDEPKKETYGGKVAAPIFAKIVSEALPFMGVPPDETIRAKPRRRKRRRVNNTNHQVMLIKTLDNNPWWSKDRFLTRASEDMVIPDLKGYDLPTALQKLNKYDLEVKVKGSGVIVSQSPESGELLESHGKIELTLARPSLLRRPVSGATLIQEDMLNGDD